MSAATDAIAIDRAAPTPQGAGRLRQVLTLVRRNLTHIKRQPEMLTDVTIQPIMFVLLFAYVFGGSINVPGVDYKPWLVPGIMAQTIAFSSFIVAIGLNTDIGKGMVDRLRSLPIARSSILVSRSIAALIHSSIGVAVMTVTGLFIGLRFHEGLGRAVLGFLLLLLFGFAMIWVGILVGSAMRSVEAVNGLMFTTIFPVTFLSNAFTMADRMPGWLRTIAEWNPISALTQALRDNWGVAGDPVRATAPWPLHHPELATLIWSLAITAVIAPLALRAFNARTTD
ncbi:ABC transporter permease [Knoellia subterranea]|uniref:Transport permease protein n=1 Tax=Knoellia subterranea KCTC 19937 TaxID=1385521 RepID=A0A0A0JKX8_9MICO|nr:ABC transporter permease [Knoellia subterranea]KGN37409.1 ABC transporter [Knoellia subterranea KCTC 19937]